MPLLYYTTEYKPERAQAEIQRLLLGIGARKISQEFDPKTKAVVGMSFSLATVAGEREFLLPIRIGRVKSILQRQGVLKSTRPDEHAAAVAWRTMLEWLKLQLAIVETDQAKADEIMLPYLLIPGERRGERQSLYEQFTSANALPSGKD